MTCDPAPSSPGKRWPRLGCSVVGYNFANWDFAEALRSMSETGFSGVEAHCPPSLRPDRGAGMARLLDRHHLRPLTYLTGGHGIDLGLGPFADRDSSDATVRAYNAEIALAADVGFPAMVVFLDEVPADPAAVEPARRDAARTLGAVAETARQRGVRILVETFAGSLADSSDAFLTIRDIAGSDNIYANVDPSNYHVVGDDVVAAIHRLGGLVAGIHLKDVIYDASRRPMWAPPGSGVVDWAAVVRALDDIGYGGPLVVEYEAGITGAFPVDAEHGARVSAVHLDQILSHVSDPRTRAGPRCGD